MGMFDWVHFEMECPTCGAAVNGFQSKDSACNLDTIEPDTLRNFYSSCPKCKAWIEFSKPVSEGTALRRDSLTLDEVSAMGFVMDVKPNVKLTGSL